MKHKILTFLMVIFLFAGCSSEKSLDLKTNVQDLSSVKSINITDKISVLNQSEAPVKLNKIKIPKFKVHDIKNVDFEKRKEVPEAEPPKTSSGHIVDYLVVGNIVYFVVMYDFAYYDYSYDLVIYQYEISSSDLSEIYKYFSSTKQILIQDLQYDNNNLYWKEIEAPTDTITTQDWNIKKYNMTAKKTKIIYSSEDTTTSQIPRLSLADGMLQWTEKYSEFGNENNCTLKAYDLKTGKILNCFENFLNFRRETKISDNSFFAAYKNVNSLLDFSYKSSDENINLSTNYKYIDYLGCNKKYFAWIDWPNKNSYISPIINIFDVDNNHITTIDVEKFGIYYSLEFCNNYLFIHVIRDKITSSYTNDFYENVFIINVNTNETYNLTENYIGKDDSAVRVQFDRIKNRNNTIYFYSEINENTESAKYEYQYLYFYEFK